MKNYIVLALLAVGLSSAAFAQDAKKADKKTMKMEKKEHAPKAKKMDHKDHPMKETKAK